MSEMEKGTELGSEARRLLDRFKAVLGEGPARDGVSPLAARAIRVETALFQQRHTDERHIGELASALKSQGSLEPLTVILVGEEPILVDGHHRLAAYQRTGRTDAIPVRYFLGTLEEAVLESGAANSKVKLNMSTQERGDCAWRLTLMGTYTKPQIAAASGASTSSVGLMRKAKEVLGAEAFDYTRWSHARRAAQGRGMDFSPEDIEDMIERTANEWATRLQKTFGHKMADRPEIAARALATYFGRRVDEVFQELREHTSDDVRDEDVNDDL